MLVTGIARYVHLINPSAPRGSDKLAYSINVLVHKSDPQCAQIQQQVEAQRAAGFPNGVNTQAKDYSECWKDCAIEEPENTLIADYMSLKCSTKVEQSKPHFVDAAVQPIISPMGDSECEGMIVNVDCNFAPFDMLSKGVKAYLNGVRNSGEAGAIPKEALTSKPSAGQMFAGVAGGTPPPATTAAPSAPTAPTAPTAPGAPETPSAPPSKVMTAKANGVSYDSYISKGWTDQQLIDNGFLVPPTSF